MRIVIAGTHSGAGKTTITAGLTALLHRRGLVVQPFKVGPDYIDPTYHSLAASRPCRNLDTWMVSPRRLQDLFSHATRDVEVSVIEGVMGLFDGLGYTEESGSTAQVAKLLRAPVVLVLDARKMARSAGAVALGYQHFDPNLHLAGFVVNRVGSESHGKGVAAAIEQATGLPVLGWLPHDPALEIPERHLGLTPTAEPGRWRELIDAAAEHVARHLDIDQLLTIARGSPPLPEPDTSLGLPLDHIPTGDRRPVIAVARDEAFSFTYEDNLDLLRAAGAEIAFFSPLRDATLPSGFKGVVIGGGFPEVYADQLAANEGMRQSLRRAQAQGIFIYAECGGLMALTESITDLQGREYPMFGLLPGRSLMTKRLTLGYRLARAAGDSWLMSRGETMRGHEFHYSNWEGRPVGLTPAYHLLPVNAQGEPLPEGVCTDRLWASYVHLHFWGQPELALRFVQACCGGSASRASR